MLYTLTVHIMRKQPTVVADYGARGHVLSTVKDDRYLLITLNVQLWVQHDGQLGATVSRPTVDDDCRLLIALDD